MKVKYQIKMLTMYINTKQKNTIKFTLRGLKDEEEKISVESGADKTLSNKTDLDKHPYECNC